MNPEALAQLFGMGIPVQPKQLHFARIRGSQPFANFDGGCFAGTIRSKESETFAASYFEIEPVDGHHLFIGLVESANAKGKVRCGLWHLCSIASKLRTFKMWTEVGSILVMLSSFGFGYRERDVRARSLVWSIPKTLRKSFTTEKSDFGELRGGYRCQNSEQIS